MSTAGATCTHPGRCLAPWLLCALAGAGHGAAFAPQPLWWAQWLCLSVLAWAVAGSTSIRHAAGLGLAFGLGWFLTGVHWLYISLHTYGGMHAALSAAAVGAFATYLALYPALAAGLATALARSPAGATRQIAAFAASWALGEWLRAVVLTGFPWIETGYAHLDGPLAGWAPVGGVHLVTLLAGALAALPVAWVRHRWHAATASAVVALLLLGGALLRDHDWTQPLGAPLRVRLLQGGIPQDAKFEPGHLLDQYRTYLQLIGAHDEALIVLPETALPVPLQDGPTGFADLLAQHARDHDSMIVTGVFIREGEDRYTNAAIAIGPQAPAVIADHTALPVYRKYHLVPFGEFVPWGFRWFVDRMVMPIGDQQHGDESQPAMVLQRRDGSRVLLGPNICYEDYFGREIAIEQQRDDAPNVLINLTNIGWFGDSAAIAQHLLASRMRALETGRPVVRATNTGATAAIDAHGRVLAELAPMAPGALVAEIQPMHGITPYARGLDRPALGLIALLLALCAVGARRK